MDKPPALDVTLLPGDAVWIPKYYPHLATSEDDRLSVSFPSRGDKGVTFQDREWLLLTGRKYDKTVNEFTQTSVVSDQYDIGLFSYIHRVDACQLSQNSTTLMRTLHSKYC